MNEEMERFFDEAKDAELTLAERSLMRNALHLFMNEHPARTPVLIRAFDTAEAVIERMRVFDTAYARGLVPTALVFTLVVGIGTSYAAQNALPGDILYPIKIHVNESLQGALVHTEAERAEWNAQLVSRRLEEAEQLVAEGKLTPVARADIESGIALSTADFNTSVAKLAATDNSTEVATAQSDLEASLTGHEQVLATLASDDKSETVTPILESVLIHKTAAATGRTQAEAQVAKQNTSAIKEAALMTQKEAKQAIEHARATLSSAPDDMASSSAALTASTTDAIDSATEGDASLESGDYDQAFQSFQAATRAAQTAQVHIEAQLRLNKVFHTQRGDNGNSEEGNGNDHGSTSIEF